MKNHLKQISGIPFLWVSFSLHNLHKSSGTLDRFHHEPEKKRKKKRIDERLVQFESLKYLVVNKTKNRLLSLTALLQITDFLNMQEQF